MNKTAKELFEEMGYYYLDTEYKIIVYDHYMDVGGSIHNDTIIVFQKGNKNIVPFFNKKDEKNKKIVLYEQKYSSGIISINLLQAINKQVEELGWDK